MDINRALRSRAGKPTIFSRGSMSMDLLDKGE